MKIEISYTDITDEKIRVIVKKTYPVPILEAIAECRIREMELINDNKHPYSGTCNQEDISLPLFYLKNRIGINTNVCFRVRTNGYCTLHQN